MGRGRFLIAGTGIILFIFMFISVSGFLNLYSQQIDPFYLRLLQQGEESFRSRNYRDAVVELEIAAFGLYENKRLLGKACVYLSLCHYYLKNLDEAERYLREAVKLGGKEGLGGLGLAGADVDEAALDEAMLVELGKLADSFQLDLGLAEVKAQAQAQPETKIPTRTEKEIKPVEVEEKEKEKKKAAGETAAPAPAPHEIESTESPEDIIKELEEKIEKEPKDTSLYYRLYELHRRSDDFKAARKTLEKLVKKNPEEVEGYYLLGKLSLERRDYRDAEKAFEKIVDLSGESEVRVRVDESRLTEAKASLVLCSYLRGDRGKAQRLAFRWMNELSPERVSSLPLDEADRLKIQEIMETYRAQAEMEKEEARIKKLGAEIKSSPQEVSLYYELYEIYRKRKDVRNAKKVIKSLVKNNPDEMNGVFLLAKIEFLQRRYKKALKGFMGIVEVSGILGGQEMETEMMMERPETQAARIDRDMALRALVYACLCSSYLKQEKNVQAYLEGLLRAASEEDILRIVKQEGLEEEWTHLKR